MRYHRDGRMVGFTDLAPRLGPPPTAHSRVPHDRDAEPHRLHRAGVPGEAVDWRTIRPGQVGGRTAPLQRGTKVTDA
ncbi:DUF6009 family protein [Streptomyces cyaneofuscatus]|uniref:DUF6009 family protein n=1 Tax=Streptomyces cyaneofuscatus TaxID=66883 RepID=UPI00366686DF